jgi:8-oxo-dGTP pyrophosphatase MutT (NUDIX family)
VSRFVDRVAAALAGSDRAPVPPAGTARQAAVAALLHESADGPRVLLMKRTERPTDPWSGHISLPGGGHHATDPNLLVTAIRETQEELGLSLAHDQLLGSLAPLSPRAAGPAGLQVTPFVFATLEIPEPVCGPEADCAFWLPLDPARAGRFESAYVYPGTQMTFPAWSFEGHVIWGLTRRILEDLLASAP